MFTTALHSGFLGALITFARTAWYPAYAETAPVWGLSALEDQQIGGAIMWIPACTVYIVASLAAMAGWMRSSEERVRRWESRPLGQPTPVKASP
jgi:putative membrane protein